MQPLGTPLITVIIPTYNRAREVTRAIRSVLGQDGADFEVIVVDDASSDESFSLVSSILDRRLFTFRHSANRGVSAARTTGVNAARGAWMVFLDSDDELCPGSLKAISRRLAAVPPSITRVCFSHRLDNGTQTPFPIPNGEVLDYEAYLRWSSSAILVDMCNCIRRHSFHQVPFSAGRSYEQLYHLDFAKRFRSLLLPDIVGIVHSDAPNRVSNLTFEDRVRKALREAKDERVGVERILRTHGDALQTYAPVRYRTTLRRRAHLYYLCGDRRVGTKHSLSQLQAYPLWPKGWATLVLGLIGPKVLAAAEALSATVGKALEGRRVQRLARQQARAKSVREVGSL
jgi:glycosyltransferase involved in cell wall biosynthesis